MSAVTSKPCVIGFDPYAGTQGKFPVTEIIRMVGSAGFEALNIYVNNGFVSGDDAQLLEVEKALAAHKVATPTVHFGIFNLTIPGEEQNVRAHTPTVLKFARRLGAKYLGIWPN